MESAPRNLLCLVNVIAEAPNFGVDSHLGERVVMIWQHLARQRLGNAILSHYHFLGRIVINYI